MKSILFVCNDTLGKVMAGPGVRSWEMARAFSRQGYRTVILSRGGEPGFSGDGIRFIGKASLLNLLVWVWRSDCIIQTGRPASILLSVLFRKKTVFDQYDPVIFEFLEQKPDSLFGRLRKKVMLFLWKARQRMILRFGHRFLVANELQKDVLLGQLTVLGYWSKLNSVAVLPFGLPEVGPVKTRSVLRGSKIRESDFLIVWGGGIWDWFDPFTLLRALAEIRAHRDDIKIYFPGVRPPSPDSRKMAVTDAFMDEARRLGLLDTMVFVHTEWHPYEQRADYLLEADAGISLHYDSLETRFAFRTRMLDYLWAGLPVIASTGDSWAKVIAEKELGVTVEPGDVGGVREAILRLADDRHFRASCRERVRTAAKDYTWDTLVGNLMRENGAPC